MNLNTLDRDQLLIGIEEDNIPKPIAYRFKHSNSTNKICEYIKKCIFDGVSFDSTNIASSYIDEALIKISKEFKVTIVTKTEKMAQVLRMTHGYNNISSLSKYVTVVTNKTPIICYWDLNVRDIEGIHIMVSIIRSQEEK